MGRCALALAPGLVLLCVEGVLGSASRSPVFLPDARLLYRPDASGAWERRHATINADGYRGRPISRRPPPERLRILALGGSTTFGHELGDAETWPHQLEALFRDEGRDVEVINGGVPGWGAEQVRIRLEQDIAWIDPDVVLVFTGWNWPVVDRARSYNPFPYPAALIGTLPGWMLQSHLFVKLSQWGNVLAGRAKRAAARSTSPEPAPPFEALLDPQLEQVAALCLAQGVPVGLILFPGLVTTRSRPREAKVLEGKLMHGWPFPEEDPALVLEKLRKFLRNTHAMLRRAAAKHGFVLLDAAASFESLPPRERLPLFIDRAHLTGAGNARLASAVWDQLRASGVLGGR